MAIFDTIYFNWSGNLFVFIQLIIFFTFFVSIIDCRSREAQSSNCVSFLTEKGEIFTWGNGSDGKLGHGDNLSRY